MGWFGPSKDEVWQELSRQIGADFVAGGFWQGSKVEAHVGPWTVTLDTLTHHHQNGSHSSQTTYTRLCAYVNPEAFRFTIYGAGFFSGLGKMLGMQDIETGDPAFDEAFVIQGTDESRVRQLFEDPRIRALVQEQPRIRLEVKDSEGWFGPAFPPDVDELQFTALGGAIKEVDRLRALFDLFAAVLDRLCRMGSAYKQEPGVTL